MTRWHSTIGPVLSNRGARHAVHDADGPITFRQALDLLETRATFRRFLTDAITRSPYTALRWETPPITTRSVDRNFEFVLVNDPLLGMEPEPGVFGRYFAQRAPEIDVLAVPNLGRTAQLVVPRQRADPQGYVHLKAFLAHAPSEQVHRLWQCIARTAKTSLSERPLWVSTAGGGVSWLHVRIEYEPKYYAYRPYANDVPS